MLRGTKHKCLTWEETYREMAREKEDCEINSAWLELALARPERTEPDRFDASLVHALRRIPEYGDRVLRVV